MEQPHPPVSRATRLKHWLLTRRHILHPSTPGTQAQSARLPYHLFFGALGWAFCRATLLFSVTPLPAALVCAAPARALPAVIGGALFGLWQGAPHPALTLCMLATALLARLIARFFLYPSGQANAAQRRAYRRNAAAALQHRLRALCSAPSAAQDDRPQQAPDAPPLPLSVRTLCAVVTGITGALQRWIRGEFTYYALFGACLILLLCPVACALLGFAILPQPKQEKRTVRHLSGRIFLLISLCFCLRGMFFWHISLACVFLLTLSLYLVGSHGPLTALGCALLGGVVLDLNAVPVLVVTVLIYVLLRGLLGSGALSVALIGGLGCALAGGTTLFASLAPSLCCGTLSAGALLALSRHSKEKEAQEASARYAHDSTANALCSAQIRTKRLRDRLCTMSAAFGGLSEALSRTDGLLPSDTPQEAEHLEHFVRECDLITGLLQDALAEDAGHLCPDDEQAVALGQAFREAGMQFERVICLRAGLRCRIELHGCRPDIATEQLHRLAERITGAGLHPPVYEDSPDGGVCRLRPRQRLRVQYASRSLAAGQPLQDCRSGEQPLLCGDALRFFSDGQDHFFALLCDGMGSGKQAAMTSGISVFLLERLLRAGVGLKTALTLLNQHLRTRPGVLQESSATVDLLSLDLFSGKARFVKSGAAQSFVLRDGQIYGVWGRTFPLGILSGIDVQIVPFTLQEGDCILMMSDGVGDALLARSAFVLQAGEGQGEAATLCDADRLYTLLGTPPPFDEEEISSLLERILCAAREYGSVDDMTVALLRVQRA